MAEGITCIYCGYIEGCHMSAEKEWHTQFLKGYEYSADSCPGYQDN